MTDRAYICCPDKTVDREVFDSIIPAYIAAAALYEATNGEINVNSKKQTHQILAGNRWQKWAAILLGAIWGVGVAAYCATAQARPQVTAPPAAQQGRGPRFAPLPPKPRVIVTTDGEIDDRESMIRFLMYANEFDVEGLIYSSSRFHWLGQTWSGVEWITSEIEMYSRIYPYLRQNADGYPTPDELRSKVYVGNIENVGEMEQDTPGADRIVQVLLDDKPGPVYLDTWGGTNTIAKALWTIQHDYPDQIDKVNKKAVVFIILDQDDTFRKYIEPNWPKLQVVLSARQFGTIAYGWAGLMPEAERVFFERPWLEGNITMNHGSLAGAYESLNGAFRSEGDSPSFMYEIGVGLRSLENPSYGGWGGRFVQEKPGVTNVWKDTDDDGDLSKPIWRWAEAFQNDWASRAEWSIKPYNQANHAPVVNVETPLDVSAVPGSSVRLSVAGSTDPDGDKLSYNWWQYRSAGTYKGDVVIHDEDKPLAVAEIPSDAKPGDTIHMIAEVTDNGKPPLTRYARIIITVNGTPQQQTTATNKSKANR